MARARCLMIGAGGMAAGWLRNTLPNFADRLEVVGLVDVNREILDRSGDFLGLPASHRFTDMTEAFEKVDADFCAIVIPPAFHRQAAVLAANRGLHIISEKPVAHTWEACVEVYRAVKQAGVKMEVIQNYRYYPDMFTFRRVLREERLGRLNYLVGRFADDYRVWGSWGSPSIDIPHALLIDGAVHHFDMLRNLASSDCVSITGWEWKPPWGQSKGEFNNFYLLRFANDVRASYEGSGTAGGTQNPWHREYYRAECENGSVIVDYDRTVRIYQHTPGQGLRMEEVATVTPKLTAHLWLVDEFLNWLEGGPTPDTTLDENLKSVAMVFAAIEASREGRPVNVHEMVAAAEVEPGEP